MKEPLANAARQPKYQKVLQLEHVACFGCKQKIEPTGQTLPLLFNAEHLASHAKAMHDALGLICPEPMFQIAYIENLMDTRVIAAAMNNGKPKGTL